MDRDYVQLCKRTNDPKLQWLEDKFNSEGIRTRRQGESSHAPILLVHRDDEDSAWKILSPIDDIPDDDPRFGGDDSDAKPSYPLPVVHMNGNSGKELDAGYDAIYSAMLTLSAALRDFDSKELFHSRDYYPLDGDQAYNLAWQERNKHLEAFIEFKEYIVAHANHIYAQLHPELPSPFDPDTYDEHGVNTKNSFNTEK